MRDYLIGNMSPYYETEREHDEMMSWEEEQDYINEIQEAE